MRGLTPDERRILTGPTGFGPYRLSDIRPLQQRGLVSIDHHGDWAEYDLTPLAALVLRLDAAARSGVLA